MPFLYIIIAYTEITFENVKNKTPTKRITKKERQRDTKVTKRDLLSGV